MNPCPCIQWNASSKGTCGGDLKEKPQDGEIERRRKRKDKDKDKNVTNTKGNDVGNKSGGS